MQPHMIIVNDWAINGYWKDPNNIDEFAAFNKWSDDCLQCEGYPVNSYADYKVPLG